MSPRTKKQNEDIRQEKRELILYTALEVFATHGYHGASVSMIANHAGIAKGLIYNYFESKEVLLKEIIREGFIEFERLFDTDKDGVLTAEELVFFINEYSRLLTENIHYWKLYYSLTFQPAVAEIIKNISIAEFAGTLFEKLEKYLEKCEFENPHEEAQILHYLFDGAMFNYLINPELFPIGTIKEYLINKYCKPFME